MNLFARVGFLTIALACLITVSSPAAAEKFTYTKNARQFLAETKINPGGAPGRELSQSMFVDTKATSTGWDLLEERGINQDDQIEGTGKHSGVAVDIMKNGDTLFQVYTGTHKTTMKDGGEWEVNYQGTMQFRGGTGKYKNATGKGTYKGRITADSFRETGEGELQLEK